MRPAGPGGVVPVLAEYANAGGHGLRLDPCARWRARPPEAGAARCPRRPIRTRRPRAPGRPRSGGTGPCRQEQVRARSRARSTGSPDAARTRSRRSTPRGSCRSASAIASSRSTASVMAGSGGSPSARRRYTAAASKALRPIACVAAARSVSTHQSLRAGSAEEQVRGGALGRRAPLEQPARRREVQIVALDARQLVGDDPAHDRVHEADRVLAAQDRGAHEQSRDDRGPRGVHAGHRRRVPERAALARARSSPPQARARPD